MEEIYLAGGCLWGVQEFVRHLPGVVHTEAGRANGTNKTTKGAYDGFAECVKTTFAPEKTSVENLVDHLFEIIDPYSKDQQGPDKGPRYRTGIYSKNPRHLEAAKNHLRKRPDHAAIKIEITLLTNFVRSDEEHQDRLKKYPNDPCHIPKSRLHQHKVEPTLQP